MKILGIESTALTASVALAEGAKCLFSYSQHGTRKHSETLLPMLESAMKCGGFTMKDVDLIAPAVGPGSFTGVRIGVSMAKGLAFSSGIPCVGVSSLESLAQNLAGVAGLICPVMDARRGRFYSAVFRSDGNAVTRLTPDDLLPSGEILRSVEAYKKEFSLPVFFTGDGYPSFSKAVSSVETPPSLRMPSAFSTALVALRIWESAPERSVFTGENLSPVYLRASQAEREADEKEGRAAL